MRALILAVSLLLAFHSIAVSQNCAPPDITFNSKSDNIFTPEQEMYLGDAVMERIEKDYRIIDDDTINAYLQSIGDRLSKHLPASGIRFRLFVADLPDTNAFALPGGRIMVTRKLISFVRSEDELAFVIGHELGHAAVRHGAIDQSRYFKQILGVNSVGDRRDVFDKYNRYLEAWRTKRVKTSDDHENNQQLEADRIGVFAIYAAGYDPTAMVPFWKRLTDAKKVGFWGAFFGERRPADKRLGEMINALKNNPSACAETQVVSTKTEFEKWKNLVINFSGRGAKEMLTGLIHRQPLEPLRSDIRHFRFSPDGQYILAQDESTITVLKRDPLSVFYRVDIEEAFPASFSTDSKSLIVYNRNLRVQRWDITEKKLISTYEIAIPGGGYWQTRVSPGGNFVACYKYNWDLVVYDVATGEEVFKEKEFYQPTFWEHWGWLFDFYETGEISPLNLEFSPDDKYFLAGIRAYNRTVMTGPSGGYDVTAAVDLTTRKKISVGGNVKRLLVTAMDFMGNNKVIGEYGGDSSKSGVFSFPEGERLVQAKLTGSNFMAGYSGDLITVRPVSGAAVGLYDLTQKKFLLGNAKSAFDVYDRTFVAERRDGEVALFNADTRADIASIALPPSPFGSLRTTALSDDGNWLVVSDRSRGAAWDMKTGKRRMHIRSFRGAYITPDAKVYSDFPKAAKVERSIAEMNLNDGIVNAMGEVTNEANSRQMGRYMIVRRPIKQKKEKAETEEEKKRQPYIEEGREKRIPEKEMSLEVLDVRNRALLWKREFSNESPYIAFSNVHDSMLLLWRLNSDSAKKVINNNPALKAKREKMGEKENDILIEIVVPNTGEVKGHLLFETNEGSFSPEFLKLAGEYLVVSDNHNRVLVYSSATGDLISRFFGNYAAVSPSTKQIAVENAPGRVTVFDVLTGAEITKLSFLHPLSLMQFSPNGHRLFVLTSDQTAFIFDATKTKPAN